MIAVGVAKPSAHGQAITSTEIAFKIASCQSPPSTPQAIKVIEAMPITTGTNTALTLSTKRWIGAFLAWADSTKRTMRANTDSVPMVVVTTCSKPSPFTAPPVTLSPIFLLTGKFSPVIKDSSTWLSPCWTRPSTGMRSPGRITTMSPTNTASMASCTSWPWRSTLARSGRKAFNARIASVVCFLARASNHLPSNTKVITIVEDSKYKCCIPACMGLNNKYTLNP